MMEINKDMEIFKDIKGYPNYQISNYGRVWSKTSQRYLAMNPNNKGYLQVHMVCINGKVKHELVHRLVALAFVDNPNNYPEVNHINRNKEDCYAENLEWCDRKTNVAKSALPKRIAIYDKKDNLIGIYDSERQACNELNLTYSNVSACLSEKSKQKTHRGYYFKKII